MNSTSTARTILFWISIVFLGTMLWKLVSTNGTSSRQDDISYSDFMAKLDTDDITAVTLYLSPNSYEVYGESAHPTRRKFRLTVPKEVVPDLLKQLREKNVPVEVKEVRTGDWTLILLNAAPLILLVGFCLFLMRQMRGNSTQRLLLRAATARTGIGYDLHRLEEGRPLIVGGIELPFDKGPVGHSDGDVLAHALCDALLGAAGLGDIGTHFPDTDPKWKGANSMIFLEHARKLLDEKQFAIEHVDAVVITEKPKLGPHFPKMREALAKALSVSAEKIHLKAKTNEGVDAIGRGEAIAAHVVATITSR
ncbi:MAG TPA: 2-C-methyl-D-erythritol 2,4-cyclodiphosphate synthase [Candidatus Acidoferrum sp.]|nr:2-C-methyl-D-erythritol 2,4-cyclodiphosphate synthase [Candidatus Acidoferrum sp.]